MPETEAERGLDFSFGRPGAQAIVVAGYTFVLRYVPYLGDQGKGLTASEIRDYRAVGLAIGLVFESTAGRMLDGYPAGVEDANQCLRSGVSLDLPAGMVYYFACDRDLIPEMFPYVDDYLRGAASVLGIGRVGLYAEFEVIKHCHEAGTATYLWQTYAWSGGQEYPYRHLYQYRNGQVLNGAEVDFNEAYGSDQGLWKAQEDEDMSVESENFKIVTWCTNEEIRDLKAGNISRSTALTNADSRIADRLVADEMQSLSDTVFSHIIAHPGGSSTLVPHVHEAGITGPADPT